MPRIHYILTNDVRPVGGLRTMFDHVGMLVRNGFDAIAISPHRDASAYRWLPDLPPTRFVADTDWDCQPGDYLVMSEQEIAFAHQVKDMRRPIRLILCQNHHNLDGRPIADPGAFNIAGVVATGRTIAASLEARFGYADLPVIPYGIDTTLFAPSDTKAVRIATMPRKRPLDYSRIREGFASRFPRFASVPWDVIDGTAYADVAAALRGAAIFLALGLDEGFGLPPLEAMASGCLVTGFHGAGGLEYATPDNGLWVEEQDGVDGCVRGLARALELVLADRDRHLAYLSQGYATVARYSVGDMERRLVRYWSDRLSGGAP